MSVYAAATGIGSWPGASPREAARIVVGELHTLPHLVELPARGVGADTIGRVGGVLVDIAIDTVPRGYRIVARAGAVTRRAVSLLDEDIDALEEAWETAGLNNDHAGRAVKLQIVGPVTLAAQLELPNGHRAITDPGALRDLAGSLAEGVARQRAQLRRRLGCEVVVQFDEPSLPAALAGRLAGVSYLNTVHPVDAPVATRLLDDCVADVGADVLVHCCASGLPWELFRRSTISAVAVDASTLTPADLDGMGEFIESGRTVVLGVVPTTAPAPPPAVRQIAQAAAAVTDRLGFSRTVLGERIGVSPACGLAGTDAEWARDALELVQKTADGLCDDPESV
ncbi:MAG: methionine synthase [Mycobacterium sp.]